MADKAVREPRPGEVLLEVVACGVCGTDLPIQDDEFPTAPPVTMGREISGLVLAVGSTPDEGWRGTTVVAEAFFSTCGVGEWCRSGRPNKCPQKHALGTFVDGGFAAQVVVPTRNLHRVPDWLDPHAAALTEPLACVCNCLCDPSPISPGDDVLVVGPGTMGRLAAQVARAAGGRVVISGTAHDAVRLALAGDLGFATILADDAAAFARLGGGFGADVVIECSGSGAGITAALQAARPRGRYVQVGIAGKAVTVPLDQICYRELTVTSGQGAPPHAWRRAMALIQARLVALEPLVSEVVPLDEWARVFAGIRAGVGVKYVFDPRLRQARANRTAVPCTRPGWTAGGHGHMAWWRRLPFGAMGSPADRWGSLPIQAARRGAATHAAGDRTDRLDVR